MIELSWIPRIPCAYITCSSYIYKWQNSVSAVQRLIKLCLTLLHFNKSYLIKSVFIALYTVCFPVQSTSLEISLWSLIYMRSLLDLEPWVCMFLCYSLADEGLSYRLLQSINALWHVHLLIIHPITTPIRLPRESSFPAMCVTCGKEMNQ